MAKVLVVDDEESIRYSYQWFLNAAGHDVTPASSVQDAKAFLSHQNFEVAIVDRILGDGNGLELIRHIREAWPFCESILISGNPNFESASETLQYDVFAYLPKPVVKETLCQMVQNAVRKNRKRIERQILHAQKMEAIGTLSGGIAHDFNNLLFIILGYVEMSLKEVAEGNRVTDNLVQMSKAVKRARSLVQQILSFSRLEEQGQKKTLVQPVLKEILLMLRASFPSTIEIHQEIDESCKSVWADPTRIHQVIMNLCTNAYHSMRKNGGRLEVKLNRTTIGFEGTADPIQLTPGKYVILTVSDTGHGIEKSLMDRIFDPYFTTKAHCEGSGMGLAMVHGIVKSMKGNITVASIPQKGSVFNVYLPEIDDAEAEGEMPSTEAVRGGNEHILLVDDEEDIVEMLQRMLSYFGYQITKKSNSDEALKLFCDHPNRFDLVVTDQTMPKITGIELTQKIRQIRPDIPVILCTGFSELVTEETLKDIGVSEYIMKPIHCKELAGIIRKVLDERSKE